ncbi:MAG: DNA repair protein RecO [Patescibacteria group bacterium]|nr:DNA repair protein RecO [Patescibacteria group bacterium]
MEETYNIKAIVLRRRPFSEGDGSVVVYSRERGKLDLVVKGMKKIKSKLAGHLEPLCLTDIMAVAGRQYDYVGSAVGENFYANIKNDLDKLTAVGSAIKIFDKLIKPGVADEKIFDLLKDYLEILNLKKDSPEILNWFFIFKLLINLGHKPELYNCVICGNKISPLGNKFDLARGGLTCAKCLIKHKGADQLIISENSIKILRLADKSDFKDLVKVTLNNNTKKEIINIIRSFFNYNF